MKTQTASARILSALSLLLCLAVLFLFPLSGCGGDTPHVPNTETPERGNSLAETWGTDVSSESLAETWEADVSSESSAQDGYDAAPQPSSKLLIPEDGKANKDTALSETSEGDSPLPHTILLIAVALWIVHDICFKRSLLRKLKKIGAGTPTGTGTYQNTGTSSGQLKALKDLSAQVKTLESKVKNLEIVENNRNMDIFGGLSNTSAFQHSPTSNGTRLGSQNPEELEYKNYNDPDVRLVPNPQGDLEIIEEDPRNRDVFVIPMLNEKTSDNPPGGVISKKSLCYSVIRSCFRVSRFPSDGLARVNITISKPALLQWNGEYYTVKREGDIVVK